MTSQGSPSTMLRRMLLCSAMASPPCQQICKGLAPFCTRGYRNRLEASSAVKISSAVLGTSMDATISRNFPRPGTGWWNVIRECAFLHLKQGLVTANAMQPFILTAIVQILLIAQQTLP